MPIASSEHRFTNHLVHETSPYLLQHAHNPVDWYPWGSEALEKARREDKPIFLSIGYAACHWCHVMERESFENEEIARILGAHFISIKVDREERPDLDEIYMSATQMVTGSGGWPMSVWLTPDLQPFYAGTYFPPDDRWGRPGFARILLALADAFEKDRGKVEQSARNIAESVERILAVDGSSSSIGDGLVAQTVDSYADRLDPLHGGIGGAPKFPHSMDLMLLLRAYRRDGDPAKWKMIALGLEKMARGGVYDQLGGGFHRYSVDDKWLVPHFEKMLYDNALLARTYLEAFQACGDEFHERVVRETLDYVIREMQSPEGGYYSSTDADSEGEEGRFFVWSPDEIREILGEADAAILCEYYDIRDGGNFEHTGKSVLSVPRDVTEVASRMGVSGERLRSVIERSKPKLLAERAKRIPPALDDKILTDWNGLMIGSMAFGGFVLNEPRYIESASRAAVTVLEHQWNGERLLHTRRAGRSHLDGMLADYAALASGLYELYRATLEPRWLESAVEIHQSMTAQFEDKEKGGFFNTLDGKSDLLLRSKSATDNAVPSGNSLAAMNAMRLGSLLGDPKLISQAERTFLAFGQLLRQSGPAFPQMLIALDYFLAGGEQLILVPGDAKEHAGEFIDPLRAKFTPYLEWMEAGREGTEQISPLLQGKKPVSGRNTAYLCRGNACLPPVTRAGDLLISVGAR